jgi:hypothetical protein
LANSNVFLISDVFFYPPSLRHFLRWLSPSFYRLRSQNHLISHRFRIVYTSCEVWCTNWKY